MSIKILLTMKDWQEKDAIILSEKVKTTTVTCVSSTSQGAKGTFTSVWAMHYTDVDKENPHASKALYTGYSTFDGTVERDGKEVKGSIVMTDDGVYDGASKTTNTVIAAYGALKDVKSVKSYHEGKTPYVEFEM